MAYSYIRVTGDGVTTVFTTPNYLEKDHIGVTVNGTSVPYTWLTDRTIQVSTPPALGTDVLIKRTTPKERTVNFQNENILTEGVLDQDSDQLIYVMQESTDDMEDAMDRGVDGHFDARNLRIANVQDPSNPQDVSTKVYVDEKIPTNEALRSETRGYRDEAVAFRDKAKAHMNAASLHRDDAKIYAASAGDSKTKAKASEDAAKISEAAAKASEEQANTYQAKVAVEGVTQIFRIKDTGDGQVNRVKVQGTTEVEDVILEGGKQRDIVTAEGTRQKGIMITEGNIQVSRLNALVDGIDVNKSIRQTALEIPEMIPVNSSGVAAATENWVGSVRFPAKNSIINMGVDCLTGSRGGMALFANTAGYNHYITTSILDGLGKFASQISGPGGSAVPGYIARPLSKGCSTVGPEVWDGYEIPTANLLYQMTTHKYVDSLNGAVWHYNPITGFAMCKYEGAGEAQTLRHPMGRKPLILNIKNMGTDTNWVSWVGPDAEFMYLNQKSGQLSASKFFPAAPNETEIYLGSTNWLTGFSTGHLLWGYFGDSLEDIFPGAAGVRGSTAVFRISASSGDITIDTGVKDIKAIIRKPLAIDHWTLHLATAGWDKYTITNQVLGETSGYTGISVEGSKVTFQNDTREILFIVIGGKMENPSTVLHQAHQGVTHYGNAQTAYELNLGHDFVSGDNGGMVMGRNIETAGPEFLFDTLGDGAGHLVASEFYAKDDGDGIQRGWTTKGVKLSNSGYINAAAFNQYLTWGTTHKKTIDGIEWQYNPATGFGMAEFIGDSVAGRRLKHPMGGVPANMWVKSVDSQNQWFGYHEGLGPTRFYRLNRTEDVKTSSALWNDTSPTKTDLTLGSSEGVNGKDLIYRIYLWTQVPGVAFHTTYRQASTTPVTIETGIEDIETIMIKDYQQGGFNVLVRNQGFGKWHAISETAPHADCPADWIKVEGSKITTKLTDNTNQQLISVFGNTVKGGRDSHIQIPASTAAPVTVSIARGFNEHGQQDKIVRQIAPVTIPGGGLPGAWYVYMTADGNLHTTSQRPSYIRSPYPLAGWSFSIPLMRMFYGKNEIPAVFLGQYKVDADGNVYDLATYSPGDTWVSQEFWAEANSLYHFPLPWGHQEIDLANVSIRHDEGAPNAEVNEQWLVDSAQSSKGSYPLIYKDSLALYTASQPSIRRDGGIHYKLKARRLF